ncbi:MAG TPA: retropepsin-like aspartic protease [Ferruginibacter sp.]|nr:retropepsin-like aspartic protease [Ferruginibacter sp.]HMP21222.1 retropepsin-like aspartic protease [Ferruginibacter sp.]
MAAVHPIDETPKKNHQQLYDKEPYVSTDSVYCIIPFSRAGNLIIIRAKADSIEGNFILDTGAPGLVLNSTYFRNFPTIETSIEISGGLTGAAENGGRTSITNFSFGPVKYSGVEADRIYMGHIENNKGIQIHGLLGMQLFSHFEMIIDYEANLLHLHHISKKDGKNYKHPLLADTSMYFEHNIEFIENKLITQAWAGGKKLKFVIDTGAESNLLDSRLPDKVMDAVDITRRVILNGAANKKVEALSGNLGSIKIGQYDADNLPVVITNLEKLCYAYDKCLDGMLGFDFLSRQKIGFNFVKRKMYIWK